jgi:hypothetical protein
MLRQLSPGLFSIEEVFLGNLIKGQSLSLPGFRMMVEDRSNPVAGREREETIGENTRILIFLKTPAGIVAGFGNCYFWSHDPAKLEPLRGMAASALALRRSWEAARDIPDERQRAAALWPFLWSHGRMCYHQTEAELQKIGPAAGDYIADQLGSMTYAQKDVFLNHLGAYRSPGLHQALIRELKQQQAAWEALLAHRGRGATYDDVDPPGRMHYGTRRPEDADADQASDIYGLLYQGFVGLGSFNDRDDLPYLREAALWGVKYRFKQVCDAVLEAFERMPNRANIAVMRMIWESFSQHQFRGNELHSYSVMKPLAAHRFPEAIPLMAQFVNVDFARELARGFLVSMTGENFGGDSTAWLAWYESNKHRLGVEE